MSEDSASTGLMLANLGSPDSPSPDDVKRYLRGFLMDPYVIDVPWPLRFFLVNFIIVPRRTAHVVHEFESIWTEEGSPLVAITKRLAEKVRTATGMPVAAGMRNGHPDFSDALRDLMRQSQGRMKTLRFMPLFPQYASATTDAVIAHIKQLLPREAPGVSLSVLPPFYEDPKFIAALADVTRPALQADYDHLLFSYHSLPQRHIRKSDPTGSHCLIKPDCCDAPCPVEGSCYRAQAFRTTEALARALGVPKEKYSVAFQSQLDSKWIGPFTGDRVRELGRAGVKKLVVVCPSFVTDCVETLEEIQNHEGHHFKEAGGETLTMVPCMNESATWVEALASWALADPVKASTAAGVGKL